MKCLHVVAHIARLAAVASVLCLGAFPLAGCRDADAAQPLDETQLSKGVYWTRTGDYSGVSVWVSGRVEVLGIERRIVTITSHVAGNPEPLLASYRYLDPATDEAVRQEVEHTLVVAKPKAGKHWGDVMSRRDLDVEIDGYP